VRWINHDVHAPLPFPDAGFDRVVCGLVLDHVRDLEHAFREMRRVSRRDGRIVITVMHPALMLRGVQARFVDRETGREVRPESRPNTISDYVLAAGRSGARIVDASEHAMDADTAAHSSRGTKYLGWPMLFCLVLEP
jgi:SAM-dependent methyltransferase